MNNAKKINFKKEKLKCIRVNWEAGQTKSKEN